MARATIHTTRPDTLEIEYETFGSPDDPALLLVMGFAVQLIHWETELCERLADAGRYVIRFDNRDIGLSSKLDGEHVDPVPCCSAVLAGEPLPPVPYTLSDMANDGIGLLDALGIERAHVMGASMGGMIVQTMAIEHPDRLLSVTSIMSAPGDPHVGAPTPEALQVLLTPPPTERDAFVDATERTQVWCSRKYFDADVVRKRAAESFDRSFYPEGLSAPARGHLRERRPHRRPPRGDDADARDPRARRQADHPERRHRHRRGDPRRPPAVPRRHGSRPAARDVADHRAVDRGLHRCRCRRG